MSNDHVGFRDIMRGVKEWTLEMAPGLKDVMAEGKAELSRLGTQGAMELASMLFNGHGFVPYGPGQYTPAAEHDPEIGKEHQQERGIER